MGVENGPPPSYSESHSHETVSISKDRNSQQPQQQQPEPQGQPYPQIPSSHQSQQYSQPYGQPYSPSSPHQSQQYSQPYGQPQYAQPYPPQQPYGQPYPPQQPYGQSAQQPYVQSPAQQYPQAAPVYYAPAQAPAVVYVTSNPQPMGPVVLSVQQPSRPTQNERTHCQLALAFWVVGLFFPIFHIVSIGIGLHLVSRNFFVKYRTPVIVLLVFELIGWAILIAMAWYYGIGVAVWWLLNLCCGMPRVILTQQEAVHWSHRTPRS
eukprot:TRINITY_DN2251_c0_g1_i1.p1 TRINITY_DN2251_c0_g1~~TRINITY_DN2251_c0_g1_i1.p1  ORF type:complete len:264 (-),score=61.88 TRINITY_DN2251_c0_g1_i1:83-874(-)